MIYAPNLLVSASKTQAIVKRSNIRGIYHQGRSERKNIYVHKFIEHYHYYYTTSLR